MPVDVSLLVVLRFLRLLADTGLAKYVIGKTCTTCGTPDDLSQFSNRVSAYCHACGRMLGEVGLFLLALAVDIVSTALATSDQRSLGGCGDAD